MNPENPTEISGSGVPRPAAHPAHIGPYRIIRVLGQGGMGTVYEAEQLKPLRRTVALKVIRRGMDTDEVLTRFESERQALAVMDHPNIARALDAGTTDDGLPYFVMELVAGEPITDYCDRHGLDVRRRLRLFLGVCRGVQHAHQKGVVHRDLKPSNILVRVTDGEPVPTIIDFGIAKAVDRRLSGNAFTTELGVMVGTPAYMSPEQADASGLDIDTRADIYSLGMVLYELMTGALPFDHRGLLPAPFIAQYVLGNADVPTPSRRVAGFEPDTATTAARHRHTTPVGLRRELRGDLDWIVGKAIERDRNRRYETANALALDLERHLEHKPIVARPPSLGYIAARFVRRHRLGVAVGATAMVALALTVTGIARERTRAEWEGAKAQAISGFLQQMLESADPWQGGSRETTVLQALRAGVASLNAGSVADPVIVATIKRTIGGVYLNLGRLAEADTLLHAALAEHVERTGPGSEETGASLSGIGWLYYTQGRYDSADSAYRRALEIRRRRLGPRDTLVAADLLNLSDVAQDRGESRRADSLALEALEILRAVHGERHASVAVALGRVAAAKMSTGDLPAVDSLTREAIAMLEGLGLDRTTRILAVRNDLALSRTFQGDPAEGVRLLREVVALDSVLFGDSHPDLAKHLENLGLAYDRAGFPDTNIALLRQAYAMRRAVLAEDNPDLARSMFNLGTAAYRKGDYAAAQPLFEESVARMRRAYGPEHTDVVYATAAMGRNQYYLGRRAEAERNLRWALGISDPESALTPRDVSNMGSIMVTLLMERRRWAEAEPLALRVLAIRDSMADTLAAQAAAQVARLYEEWGKPERAREYRREAR